MLRMDPMNDRKQSITDITFRWLTFASVALATLLGPWFFGAWEVWWFWPFVAVISAGTLATGLRLVFSPAAVRALPPQIWLVMAATLPFLVYAGVRLCMTDVFMDAERSVLLHLSALAIAAQVILGLSRRRRHLVFWLVSANLLLLGLYGVINHLVCGSQHVLLAPRYEQYAGRATGSYFCPDHFAGAMELLLCLAIGVLADRGQGALMKWTAGIAAAVAVAGVVMSQSRGGGMTVVVILVAAMVWGVAQWPRAVRWNLRLIGVSSALLLLIGLWSYGGRYIERFASYGGVRDKGSVAQVAEALGRTCRGRMYGGAVRAWQTAPWLGVGPGLHQNLWPHFAPTSDSDPELGIWPTLPNDNFHSYEVHSDWLQLLEEYGLVGFVLFLIPFCMVFTFLAAAVSTTSWERDASSESPGNGAFTYAVGATLAVAAMTFHSLGDFNLQMPATTWVLATVVAIALGRCATKHAKGANA